MIPRVLVLGGTRGGGDPVAAAAGVSHKALALVDGEPMLARVVGVVRAALPDSRIGVAIDPAPDVSALLASLGDIAVLSPGPSPCATVSSALDRPEFMPPLLIVTADSPLLTPAMLLHFLDGLSPGVDAAVAVARRETVEAEYRSKRTYWRFADVSVSGCNLFYIGPARARDIVTFWRRLEADRKKPWKMVRHLGGGALIAFVLGRLALADALDRLGRRVGASLATVDMPFAAAPIDVDGVADLALADSILRMRRAEPHGDTNAPNDRTML